jgi:hypothetical protein
LAFQITFFWGFLVQFVGMELEEVSQVAAAVVRRRLDRASNQSRLTATNVET